MNGRDETLKSALLGILKKYVKKHNFITLDDIYINVVFKSKHKI